MSTAVKTKKIKILGLKYRMDFYNSKIDWLQHLFIKPDNQQGHRFNPLGNLFKFGLHGRNIYPPL